MANTPLTGGIDNLLDGGPGSDSINGGQGIAVILNEFINDGMGTVTGSINETLLGDSGADSIRGSSAHLFIDGDYTSTGNERWSGGIDGGADNDVIIGSRSSINLTENLTITGATSLSGGDGISLDGGSGLDHITLPGIEANFGSLSSATIDGSLSISGGEITVTGAETVTGFNGNPLSRVTAVLNNSGTITSDASINVQGGNPTINGVPGFSQAEFNNNQDGSFDSTGPLTIGDRGIFNNSGSYSGGALTVTAFGDFNNSNTGQADLGTTIVPLIATNDGTITNDGGSFSIIGDLSGSGSFIQTSGTTSLQGSMELDFIDIAGELDAAGTIIGSSGFDIGTGGTLSPGGGGTIGEIETEDLNLFGELKVDIDNTDSDLIFSSLGTINLFGDLNVTMLSAPPGTTYIYTLVLAEVINGVFANVAFSGPGFTASVSYDLVPFGLDAALLTINAAPIPLPPAWVFALSGAAALMTRRRRTDRSPHT